MTEAYHRSGGQLPSWNQARQLAAMLGQYGKITDTNVYYWFRNYRIKDRQGAITVTTGPSAITDSPVRTTFPLFPVQGGELARNRSRQRNEGNVQVVADADEDLVRLELRTRQE